MKSGAWQAHFKYQSLIYVQRMGVSMFKYNIVRRGSHEPLPKQDGWAAAADWHPNLRSLWAVRFAGPCLTFFETVPSAVPLKLPASWVTTASASQHPASSSQICSQAWLNPHFQPSGTPTVQDKPSAFSSSNMLRTSLFSLLLPGSTWHFDASHCLNLKHYKE